MIDVKKAIDRILDKFQQKPVLLWTNPNPTNTFVAQTITESSSGWVSGKHLSDYTFVRIEYRLFRTVNCASPSIFASISDKGKAIWMSGTDGISDGQAVLYSREYEVNSNEIKFYDCKQSVPSASIAWGTNHEAMIPQKIYGIK